jgi:hypothetical protein
MTNPVQEVNVQAGAEVGQNDAVVAGLPLHVAADAACLSRHVAAVAASLPRQMAA